VAARFQKQLDEERRLREAAAPDDEKEELEGDEEVVSTNWKNRLLEVLRKLSPDTFERLAQRLLRESGFIKVEVTGRSGDGGIDGIGVLRLNLLSFQVLFQCKRYQGSVGAPAIRDFRGAMVGRSDKGLMITTGTFTPDATREATRDGAPTIDLIDGDRLCELLQEKELGVKTELVKRMTVDSNWFDGI
jgi:restriction system protein